MSCRRAARARCFSFCSAVYTRSAAPCRAVWREGLRREATRRTATREDERRGDERRLCCAVEDEGERAVRVQYINSEKGSTSGWAHPSAGIVLMINEAAVGASWRRRGSAPSDSLAPQPQPPLCSAVLPSPPISAPLLSTPLLTLPEALRDV